MRTYRHASFDRFGGPDVIRVVDSPMPEPGPDAVRIQVEASSVQFTDTLIRAGVYPDVRGPLPVTPGYDVVGRVDAVGGEVTRWKVGDRVADLCTIGGNATHVLRPAAGLVRVPDRVDAAEAATLVLSWVTAWQAIVRNGGLKSGETLLVHGGMGAVGQAAINLGVRLGARVIATARASHADAVRALGAEPVDYRSDWLTAVRAAGGADVVLDGVGERLFFRSRSALKPGGRLVAIGVTGSAKSGALWMTLGFLFALFVHPWLPGSRRASFYGITQLRKADPAPFREDLERLLGWLDDGSLRVRVAKRIGLAEVGPTHAALEAGGLDGKVVVVPERG
jgi:NADPH:quinone reductase-like Zn-dependent oxidoreductase